MGNEKDSRPRPKVEVGEPSPISAPIQRTEQQEIAQLMIDDVEHEITIQGIKFVVREIDGKTLTGIVDRCTRGDPTRPETLKLDRAEYISKLIELCVIRPKIQASRLKPSAFASFGMELETFLGLSEQARKNLEQKSETKSSTG